MQEVAARLEESGAGVLGVEALPGLAPGLLACRGGCPFLAGVARVAGAALGTRRAPCRANPATRCHQGGCLCCCLGPVKVGVVILRRHTRAGRAFGGWPTTLACTSRTLGAGRHIVVLRHHALLGHAQAELQRQTWARRADLTLSCKSPAALPAPGPETLVIIWLVHLYTR